MGKNNRARRAAKAKKRSSDRRGPTPRRSEETGRGPKPSGRRASGDGDGHPLSDEQIASSLWYLIERATSQRRETAEYLDHLSGLPPASVARAAEEALATQIATCWESGWQPVELVRQGRRATSSAAAGRLVGLSVAIDNINRRASTIDHRWRAQIEGLDLPRVDGRVGWLTSWRDDEGLESADAWVVVSDALVAVSHVPPLQVLIPPPGSSHARTAQPPLAGDRAGADPVLDRIRSLLAKAESTDFEAEAIAFTAKAQELMTRHAVDAALMDRGPRDAADPPIIIRIMIDAPYVGAKSLLLHEVAEAGRCRSVLHRNLDLATVVGLVDDVAAVDLLFTSLLVQAQSAMADALGGRLPERGSGASPTGPPSSLPSRIGSVND